MIYITGDLHGGYDIEKLFRIDFSSDDILIVCGDFGYVWEQDYHKRMSEQRELNLLMMALNCTLLFVDGNHECFPRLNSLPKLKRFGAEVGVVRDKCYHLLRGNVYTIEGKKFLAIGGAESHDTQFRHEGINWWKDESITNEDVKKAMMAGEVDYVISHCLPATMKEKLCLGGSLPINYIQASKSENLLEYVYNNVQFKRWFCGHYHLDERWGKFDILFRHVIKLED